MDSLDNVFIFTLQNIIGKNLIFCKWTFIFTSIGISVNLFFNSFILFKIKNETELFNQKIKLLLNESNLILENNVNINENIKSINKKLISINEFKKFTHKDDKLDSNYDFL